MILINPSKLDLVKMDREQGGYQEARAFLDSGNLYAWPVFDDLHANMSSKIGVSSKAIPLIIAFDNRGKIWHVVVTDYSERTDHWHSPYLAQEIAVHPRLRWLASSDLDIGYYDEAIYGDWQEIEEEEEEDTEEEFEKESRNWYNRYIIACVNKETRPVLKKK